MVGIMEIIPICEMIESWETITIIAEDEENINKITVRMLERDFKYIYTFIKKQGTVKAIDVFQRFPKMDVEHILLDLRDMYLVYFTREMK